MGICTSKPLPASRNYVRDSVVLCDGLSSLHSAKHAGAGDGRYVLVLGNMHMSSSGGDEPTETSAISFQLDIIDLFLSKRTRIDNVGDFYNLGHLCGFYALDERTVVLVDYDPMDKTLRQRLISINLKLGKAECNFYRGYTADLDSFFAARTARGEEFAVTIIPSLMESPPSGIVYPVNPLSTKQHRDITLLLDQANAHVRQYYAPGEAGDARISTFHPPFFVSSTVLGFFIDPQNVDDLIDPMHLLVMDISSNLFYLQEAKRASKFPLSNTLSRPAYAKWTQANDREVAMISRFRRTGFCWQVGLASLILGLFQYVLRASLFFLTWNCRGLSLFCLHTSMRMLGWRSKLLEPRNEEFTGFGTLNTRTLEWQEIKATVWADEQTKLIPFRDGQFVIGSTTTELDSGRLIGIDLLKSDSAMDRYRLIGNPNKMMSLTRLSSIAAQKSERIDPGMLELIATRIR